MQGKQLTPSRWRCVFADLSPCCVLLRGSALAVLICMRDSLLQGPITSTHIASIIKFRMDGWLEKAREYCSDRAREEADRDIVGGIIFHIANPRTYWTDANQFLGWWKNNIERKLRFREIENEASSDLSSLISRKQDEMKLQRVRWCQRLVTLVREIKSIVGGHQSQSQHSSGPRPMAALMASYSAAAAASASAAAMATGASPVAASPSPTAFAGTSSAVSMTHTAPVMAASEMPTAVKAAADMTTTPDALAGSTSFVSDDGGGGDGDQPLSTTAITHHVDESTDRIPPATSEASPPNLSTAAVTTAPPSFPDIYDEKQFVLRLFDVVSDETISSLHWYSDAASFFVLDPSLFVYRTLPKHFKRKFCSPSSSSPPPVPNRVCVRVFYLLFYAGSDDGEPFPAAAVGSRLHRADRGSYPNLSPSVVRERTPRMGSAHGAGPHERSHRTRSDAANRPGATAAATATVAR